MKKTTFCLNHQQAPLYDVLCNYEKNHRLSLHVPGHKDGRVFDHEAYARFKNILTIDGTASKELDVLNDPKTFIKEAESLASEAFGADKTFFLVGGSTVGNLAIALSLCEKDDSIIVQRNMHKSVFNGLTLAGAKPVFISPAIDINTQTAKVANLKYFEKAIKHHPKAKAVWITNPNYYGISEDITKLAELCHAHNLLLVVDEAHGAHFGQVEGVPPSALSQGADIVVQSTHKMLTAMTMGSMLHIKGALVKQDRIARVLGMLQSTSPSYPILASLDLARRYLVMEGRQAMIQAIPKILAMRDTLNDALGSLKICLKSNDSDYLDPFRWVITDRYQRITGYELIDIFYEQGCTAELSGVKHVVFLFSIAESELELNRLAEIMRKVDHILASLPMKIPLEEIALFEKEGTTLTSKISLQKAFYKPRTHVALEESIGKICGEIILPYPPGIPLLMPGEVISAEDVSNIKRLSTLGAYFEAASDEKMEYIYIIRDEIPAIKEVTKAKRITK